MEYYSLLERAVKAPTSLERLCHLAAYALSPYSSAQRRSHKPFNPMLGETFEWEQEGHYRMMVEQVWIDPNPGDPGLCGRATSCAGCFVHCALKPSALSSYVWSFIHPTTAKN